MRDAEYTYAQRLRPTTQLGGAKQLEAKAIAKYIRVSPRKVRAVIDLIRGKKLDEALAILRYTPNRATEAITKVVKSAAANAENNLQLSKDDLFVKTCFVDQGPTIKRVMPRAQGRADIMRRRTSHITVVVGEKESK
jgi:large subunit ribosomal protein L22